MKQNGQSTETGNIYWVHKTQDEDKQNTTQLLILHAQYVVKSIATCKTKSLYNQPKPYFFKKLLWSHFWIYFNKFYTKAFRIVYMIVYLLIMFIWEVLHGDFLSEIKYLFNLEGNIFTYINQKCYFLLWLFQLRWTLIQHFQVFHVSKPTTYFAVKVIS